MRIYIFALLLTLPFQQPDHSDKPCVVTEVVAEGVRPDCHGWKPTNSEKMFAPAEVNQQLRVGDTFYFVWKETRWVAEIKETVSITLTPDSQAIILPRSQAEQEFKQLCADGTDDLRLRALAVALNPMPDWPQMVMNGDSSVCNRSPKAVVPVPIENQRGQ